MLAEQAKYIPLGTPMKLSVDGVPEMMRCYRLGEFRLLLKADFKLQDIEERLRIYQDIELKYIGIIEEKDKIAEIHKREKEIYRERAERMEADWHDAEARAVSAEGPIWPYIAAGVGAAVGIVGITLYVQEMSQRR
jgi:hypothetical protein